MDNAANSQRAIAAYLAERLREARHSRGSRRAADELRDRRRRARPRPASPRPT